MTFSKKRHLILVLVLYSQVLTGSICCFGQTPNANYIRTRIPKIPVTDTSALDTIPIQRQAVNVTYKDALGRDLQSVQVQGSPNQNDVILPYAYDNMGRAVKNYLPYAGQGTTSSTKGTFRVNALTDALNFYGPSAPGAPKIAIDASPFAQSIYEASPLGRIMEQGNLGSVSQPGTGHSTKVSYNVNGAADGISYYNIQEGASLSTTAFKAGMLTKTIVTDENGHRQAIWKDMQGRTVSKAKLDAPTQYYSTDYVYNDLGQLSDIVPPSAKKQLAISNFSKQSYIFHYDSIGRMVEKKIPGKGWMYIVYNRTDQPVLSQDSNMRVKNQWVYMKYDAEGRVIQTGLYINKAVTDRKALQYLCDNSFPVLWETWQPGTGYTNNAFPQQSAIPDQSPLSVYTVYYYNDYSFSEASNKPFQANIYNPAPSLRTMGKLTGVSVYVLGTANQRLVTVFYYDKQDHLIQEISDNHLGQVDVVNNQFDFEGELTCSQRTTVPLAGSPFTLRDRYVYDHMGRLMDTYESFQGSSELDISHNVYNEISQKVSEGLHSTGYGIDTITENTALTTGKTDIAGKSVILNPGFSFTATTGNSYIATIGTSSVGFAQTQEFRYNIKSQLTTVKLNIL